MSPAFSLSQVGKAPLNTTIEFVGFETLMGLGGAYFQVVFLVNLCALRLLCGLAAKGQTSFADIIYGGIVIQFCELILNQTISQWIGVYSIGPIYVVTVLLLMKFCELPLSDASKIGGLYYAYHAVSVICLRLIVQRLV